MIDAVPGLLLPFLGGLLLAAAAGLRAFLPLCALGWAAHFHLVTLNASFSWLATTPSLIGLTAAVVLELAADKVPLLDHALDAVGLLAKPVAAVVAMAASLSTLSPQAAFVVGVVAGGPLAGGTHLVKAKSRLVANAATAGLAAPVLSLLEDVAGVLLVAAAILLPVAAVGLALLVVVVVRHLRARRSRLAAV